MVWFNITRLFKNEQTVISRYTNYLTTTKICSLWNKIRGEWPRPSPAIRDSKPTLSVDPHELAGPTSQCQVDHVPAWIGRYRIVQQITGFLVRPTTDARCWRELHARQRGRYAPAIPSDACSPSRDGCSPTNRDCATYDARRNRRRPPARAPRSSPAHRRNCRHRRSSWVHSSLAGRRCRVRAQWPEWQQ